MARKPELTTRAEENHTIQGLVKPSEEMFAIMKSSPPPAKKRFVNEINMR